MNLDQRLAASLVKGLVNRRDREAWRDLVDRTAPMIKRVSERHVLGPTTLYDVSQDVWLRLLQEINDAGEPSDLALWVNETTELMCTKLGAEKRRLLQPSPTAVALGEKRRSAIAGFSVRSLTGLAAFLAGREGPDLHDESDSHLAGEGGHDRAAGPRSARPPAL